MDIKQLILGADNNDQKCIEILTSNYMSNFTQDYNVDFYANRKGKSWSSWYVAYMYRYGHGVKKDYSIAISWLNNAIELGNSNAMMELAWMYQYGYGVSKDYDVAISWYRYAIKLGNSNAMSELAWMYRGGLGVNQDYSVAISWYNKAIELGNSNAMATLASMYLYCNGVEQDYCVAIKLYNKVKYYGSIIHIMSHYDLDTISVHDILSDLDLSQVFSQSCFIKLK